MKKSKLVITEPSRGPGDGGRNIADVTATAACRARRGWWLHGAYKCEKPINKRRNKAKSRSQYHFYSRYVHWTVSRSLDLLVRPADKLTSSITSARSLKRPRHQTNQLLWSPHKRMKVTKTWPLLARCLQSIRNKHISLELQTLWQVLWWGKALSKGALCHPEGELGEGRLLGKGATWAEWGSRWLLSLGLLIWLCDLALLFCELGVQWRVIFSG